MGELATADQPIPPSLVSRGRDTIIIMLGNSVKNLNGFHMYSSYAYAAINISPNFTQSPQGTPLLQERSRGLLQPGGHTRGLQW